MSESENVVIGLKRQNTLNCCFIMWNWAQQFFSVMNTIEQWMKLCDIL